MDFKSTYTIESKSLPGVVVTLKRLGPKRRAETELSVSGARAKQRELSMRHEATRQKLIAAIDASPKDADGKPVEPDLRPECLALALELQGIAHQAAAQVRAEIHPAFLRSAIKSFSGEPLTYDGAPASAELVIECGPSDLFDEIVSAVNANGYLAAEIASDSSSLSTSGAAMDGVTIPSTAATANPGASS